jgi:nitrate reductase molybdenum cofactor assembly chaperone NarJ/NarW
MITLRALGALLTYPRRELLEALPEIGAAVASSGLIGLAQKERIVQLIAELQSADPFDLEERYVHLFDTGRSTSLCLFEHVHGESRERGAAMVDLKSVYERAGFQLASSELPDYLPVLLEYLSCREPAEARAMLGDCAHILRALGERLAARGSRYACVLDALLAVAAQPGLDWSTAPAPPEPIPHVDEDWMDAPAFGPGSQKNQGGEPGVTPIRFMPQKGRGTGAPP